MHVEGQLAGLVLAFHHVGPGDQTQVARFGGKCLYPLSRPACPCCFHLDLANI